MSTKRLERFLSAALAAAPLLLFAGPVAAQGVVALKTCDVSCPDDSTRRYVGCDNGTVTDNLTGLVWLANADCFGPMTWMEAMAVVAGLGDMPAHICAGMDEDACDCGLSDHSSPGEWRLPSMAEWREMMTVARDSDLCDPAILNDAGNDCWDEQCAETLTCSFYGMQSAVYWSSSTYMAQPANVWVGDLSGGFLDLLAHEQLARIWPVRRGQ